MKFLPSLIRHSFPLTQDFKYLQQIQQKQFFSKPHDLIFNKNFFSVCSTISDKNLKSPFLLILSCCAIRMLVGSTLPKFVSMTRGWEASGSRMCLMLARIWVSSGKETVSNKYELKSLRKLLCQPPSAFAFSRSQPQQTRWGTITKKQLLLLFFRRVCWFRQVSVLKLFVYLLTASLNVIKTAEASENRRSAKNTYCFLLFNLFWR